MGLNEKKNVYEATFANLGINKVVVPSETVKQHQKLLVGGVWCLAYIRCTPAYPTSQADLCGSSDVLIASPPPFSQSKNCEYAVDTPQSRKPLAHRGHALLSHQG